MLPVNFGRLTMEPSGVSELDNKTHALEWIKKESVMYCTKEYLVILAEWSKALRSGRSPLRDLKLSIMKSVPHYPLFQLINR
uniref:Uncharacterized protein n=1 Tax=Steinernema glaseri TaxID=37863 RepID=A0A1I7YFJ0_9BILA